MHRFSRASNRAGRTLAPALLFAVAAWPTRAAAEDFSLELEHGLALPLSPPQSTRFASGLGESLTARVGLTRFLDVGPTASYLFLPAAATGESGTAWGFGGGARVHRPRGAVSYGGVSPWLSFDALYVRTGDLDRAGFDVALGLALPLGSAHDLWVGPLVRYMQTLQPASAGTDTRDAKILFVGVDVELGTAHRTAAYVEPIAAATLAPAVPHYTKVVVHADKLELTEKLYFRWDEATIEDTSFDVLDEVVQALDDHPGLRVRVDGYTDSTGPDDHNQSLSEQRAAAVVTYLVAHGIARDRLTSTGFSSQSPIDTNATAAGRENNRRVEFVVSFFILRTDGAQ